MLVEYLPFYFDIDLGIKMILLNFKKNIKIKMIKIFPKGNCDKENPQKLK